MILEVALCIAVGFVEAAVSKPDTGTVRLSKRQSVVEESNLPHLGGGEMMLVGNEAELDRLEDSNIVFRFCLRDE